MSTSVKAQDDWIKAALGFDVEAALAGGAGEGDEQARGGFFDFVKRKVGEITGEIPPPPQDKDFQTALDALDDKIEAVELLGLSVKQIKRDRNDAAWAGDKAEKLTGDARDKGLAAAKDRVVALTKHAETLIASAKSVMGTTKGAPNATQISAIYKKALEDHYDIKIENPTGMANTHLDRVFDMFATVPIGDAKQDKLKTLAYKNDPGWANSGAYNRVELAVKMGDFGDASGEENYEIDGEVLPVNSFDVTTLHEIGHAVDNKHGVMASHGGKAGCGNWERASLDIVAAAFLPEFKSKVTLTVPAADDVVLNVIKLALEKGDTTVLAGIDPADAVAVAKFLTDYCLRCRSASSPWFRGAPVVGGRVYQEAYSKQWWSYADSAKTATKVNSYQWRAPGEWFAEVYAVTWLKKKKPPAGVDASAATYMWNG